MTHPCRTPRVRPFALPRKGIPIGSAAPRMTNHLSLHWLQLRIKGRGGAGGSYGGEWGVSGVVCAPGPGPVAAAASGAWLSARSRHREGQGGLDAPQAAAEGAQVPETQ